MQHVRRRPRVAQLDLQVLARGGANLVWVRVRVRVRARARARARVRARVRDRVRVIVSSVRSGDRKIRESNSGC